MSNFEEDLPVSLIEITSSCLKMCSDMVKAKLQDRNFMEALSDREANLIASTCLNMMLSEMRMLIDRNKKTEQRKEQEAQLLLSMSESD